MVTREYVLDKILNAIPCDTCDVEDVSDSAVKFKVLIISQAFAGKSLLQRHRLIYSIFTEELKGPIHALSLTTLSPSDSNPITNYPPPYQSEQTNCLKMT